jgi:hypothetical protein
MKPVSLDSQLAYKKALETIRDYRGPKWPDEMTLKEKVMQQCILAGIEVPPEYSWLGDDEDDA